MRFYAGFVHQAAHGDGFADVPKAGRLSASERPGGSVAKLGSIARILYHPRLAANDDEFILACDASSSPHDVLKLLSIHSGGKYPSVPADLELPKTGSIGINAGLHKSLE